MNWTGGKLQRSKQANKGIVQIQKAHFARARTRLQNGSNSLTSPLHPRSSRDDEAGLGGQLPSFSSRPVCHVGHGKPLQERRGKVGSAPSQHGAQEEWEMIPVSPKRRRGQNRMAAYARSASGDSRSKRKADSADPEESLLEARRKKLLRQQDWAGLTRSKPIPTHFASSAERVKVGKRRKIKGRGALTVRPMRYPSPARQLQNQQPDTHLSGVLPGENIRIRIGMDALTNITTQRAAVDSQGAAISRDESSDVMLFDDEALHTAPKPSQSPAQIGDQDRRAFVGGHKQVRAPPEMRGEGLQACQASDQKETSYRTRTHDAAQSDLAQCKHIRASSARNVSTDEVDKVSGCYITQYNGGVDRPLRLVFDRTSDNSAAVEEDTWVGYTIGETNHVHKLTNASLGEDRHHSEVSRAVVGQPQIVDDSPWRLFISIPDDSSNRSTTADASESNRQCSRPTPQASGLTTGTEPTPWSQHATQGGQTRTNSPSCISASLPSVARGSEKDTLGKQPHIERKRGMSLGKMQRDGDEQLWHAFVFGDEIATASDTADDEAAVNADENAVFRRVIPSSVVVGSLSSRASRAVSGSTCCVSEGIQDTAGGTPRPTSSGSMPMIASSAAPPIRRQGQGWSKGEEGAATQQIAEGSDFGTYAVTRTCIQDNASYEASNAPSRISGDPWAQTSRANLYRRESCKSNHYGPVLAKSDEPASVHNMPVSDNSACRELDLLDLVEYC